jgi:hypothetical protein
LAPDQAPDAVQLVALVAAQVSFEVPPDVTEVGAADNVRVGLVPPVPPVTVTVLDAVCEPPVPVQVSW